MIDLVTYEKVYKQWSAKLYNFILKLSTGNEYLAEEIVQSTFLKVWEIRNTLEPDNNLESYIYSIAKNQLYNYFSRQMLRAIYEEKLGEQEVLAENEGERNLDYQILEDYLEALIEELPPSRKAIFLLSRRDGLSNKEISAQLNISVNTVESQMTKAIKYLRKRLSGLKVLFSFFLFP